MLKEIEMKLGLSKKHIQRILLNTNKNVSSHQEIEQILRNMVICTRKY